ncbi:MAG: hypothetical protein ACMG55_07265 [Microcoleus sp.]
MKRSTIAPAFILAGAMLIGGLSACASPNTPSAAEPNSPAAIPVSSSEMKADTASSKDATPDVVAANPTNSQKPKMSDAERAQKRKEISEKLAKVLTPEQYKSLDAKLKSGEKMRKALTEINLTAEQKPKVKAILKAAYPRTQNGQKSSEAKPQ